MMETKWYHGVKWTASPQRGPASNCFQAQVWDVDGCSLACIEPTEDGVEANRHAELFAAAPETATQRDSLLSVQKQLVEALEELRWVGNDLRERKAARAKADAAIQAAKASL